MAESYVPSPIITGLLAKAVPDSNKKAPANKAKSGVLIKFLFIYIYLVLNSVCVFCFMRIIADVSPVVKPLFSNPDKQRNENNQA